MSTRPAFLRGEHAEAFRDRDVAAAYRFRPPYPEPVFALFDELLVDRPRTVLDLGCGTGFIARHLVDHADRVDAVDVSQEMIEEGKRAPNGDHPALRWIVGRAEDAPLDPPYALVTAGASLHWMDWHVVLPRLGPMLTPRGQLVILNEGYLPLPWGDALRAIIRRYSVNQDFQPAFDLVAALAERGLFVVSGRRRTEPVPFRQSLDDYIASFHARSALSRARMGEAAATSFDDELRRLVSSHCGSTVELQIVSDVAWGRPLAPA